jgi:hypothetical protein
LLIWDAIFGVQYYVVEFGSIEICLDSSRRRHHQHPAPEQPKQNRPKDDDE